MKRTAFTLVELLTVVAIIGILVGLLLPAVHSVREAARRTACQNNIRQIGLGLQNFHSQHIHFPHGWNAKNGHGESGWGWLAYTLPFLEQSSLYDQIDFSVRMTHLDHNDVVTKRIDLLFCPSSPARNIDTFDLTEVYLEQSNDERNTGFPFEVARTNYVGSIGSLFTPTELIAGS